jgi:hypothetical protein
MLKLVICVALVSAVVALPTEEPLAADPVDSPELLMAQQQASYDEAKATVTALLQDGKDDSACRDLATTTADEVKESVKQQQQTLAGMPNGNQCNSEGQGLIDSANSNKQAADQAKTDALSALNAAKSEEFNFGNFKYTDLTEGQCGTFFNSQVWQNAKNKVNAAQGTYNTKSSEATAAAKAVEDAKTEAAKLVKKCKCDTKTNIESTMENMNANAKDANTKAWNKAYHMECVLDGKTTNNCNVPTLPTVQPVPFGDGVEDACGSQNAGEDVAGTDVKCGGWTGGTYVGHIPRPTTNENDDGPGNLQPYKTKDPFKWFDISCNNNWSGTHQCSVQEIELAASQGKWGSLPSGHVVASCGKYSASYGWHYTCRYNSGHSFTNPWTKQCNGQAISCCRGGTNGV